MAVPSDSANVYSYNKMIKFVVFQVFVICILHCEIGLTQSVTLSPICGSDLYDIQTLISAPYWTISKLGICYDTYDTSVPCVINLAFCKDLPPKLSRMEFGVGASQQTDFNISTTLVLGHQSIVSDDESGNSLFVGYSDGDQVDCGTLNVLMELRCNRDAAWAVNIDGSPTEIPEGLVEVTLDKPGCVYAIAADYAGACTEQRGLSAGTVLIIIFFIVVTLYLLCGLLYNKVAGATGKELIPNYEIWKNLPSDIMVGSRFFISCITCQDASNPSQDSYDAI